MKEEKDILAGLAGAGGDLDRFADSYAAFTRIINGLQRRYIELEQEFAARNEQLAEANQRLSELTERNQSANRFLNGVLDIVSAGVIAVDQSGMIILFNTAAASMLKVSGQVAGEHYRDIITKEAPAGVSALETLKTGKPLHGAERTMDLSDGTRLHLAVSTSVLRNQRGEVCGAVEVFHDLTRIRKMESELARLNTLAALGQMAASVAHEVRNPLAGIAGFVSLLERDLQENDPKQQIVQKIMRGVNNLNDTVTSLLNYTRFDELNIAEIEYHEYLQGVIDQFAREYAEKAKKVAIRLMPLPREVVGLKVKVDRLLMRQVFFNLFANSADAVSEGGVISVAITYHTRRLLPSHLTDKLLLDAGETVVEASVLDNGPGIPPENLESVFSPFFSTKKSGNGLGLAVGQKIVRAHGGEMIAENALSGGAMFRLLLPIPIQHHESEQIA